MLLHAGLIVRHSSMVLPGWLEEQAFGQSLAEICRGSGERVFLAEVPDLPISPDRQQSDCLICKGSVSAVAIITSPELISVAPEHRFERMAVVHEVISRRIEHAWPPPTGPPPARA